MPFEVSLAKALDAFSALFKDYQSAVAATLEEVRGQLVLHTTDHTDRSTQLRTEFGPFAEGRIDFDRLAAALGEPSQLPPAAIGRLERASAVLREIAGHGPALMHVHVGPGDDLVTVVRTRLAIVGRAFGAAHVAAARDVSRPLSSDEEALLAGFPYRNWTPAERRVAPPLVVSLHGAECHVGGLAEFLDGGQKIALVVDGPCPPAPLVRLITPGLYVAQTENADSCRELARWPGAAIVAIVPDGCARFVHDPSGGIETWQRLKIGHMPAEPRSRVGGLSLAQQVEELRQLEALSHHPAAATVAAARTDAAADPVDRVAAWLLQQANLTETAGGH